MSLPTHRDIYAGMVAQALDQRGCFGREIELYTFYAWHGILETPIFSDEDACVHDMLCRYEQGQLLSEMVFYKKHVYEPANTWEQTYRQAANQAQRQLAASCGSSFQEAITRYQSLPAVNKEELIASFLSHLTPSQQILVPGILAMALARKWINPDFVSKQSPPAPPQLAAGEKAFAGFSCIADGRLCCFSNAYLPNIWRKWCHALNQGQPATGIILHPLLLAESEPMSGQKAAFDEYLSTICTKELLSFIQSLSN